MENGGRVEALAGELDALFEKYRAISDQHPTSNPLLRLSLDIASRLESGALDYSNIEQLVQFLTVRGFASRADKLCRYTGETHPDRNAEIVRRIVLAQALTESGATRPFEHFKGWAESDLFGIVITAHPTFEISSDLMRTLSALAIGRANGRPLDEVGREALLAAIAGKAHGPEKTLDLKHEQELALFAIGNINRALKRVYGIALDVAAEIYPSRWTELTPILITVASWVGFDTDGRSDIGWSNAFERRLEGSAGQLRDIAASVAALNSRAADNKLSRGEDLRVTLDLVAARVARSLANAERENEALTGFDSAKPDALDAFRRVARRMYEARDGRLDNAEPLVVLLDRALRLAGDGPSLTRDLLVLRAELVNFGLGTSHIHARINATQLHNAIRKAVALEANPDDPRHRQSYLHKITNLIAGVEPLTINFGSLAAERTSSKRLFMTIAQILKYVDNGKNIRLLIAECESPFTVLTALYYARLFGIADRVEICPLFETERALERGSRVIEQLLDNPAYAAYVRAIGCLCVQTGYSDAGRYIGQTPASGSIERLKDRVIRLVARRPELGAVKLIFFDTHGESIGRGGHPEGFPARFDYVASPALMAEIHRSGIAFKQETSFQGGDGYLYFQSEDAAFAALTRILEWSAKDRGASVDDVYYSDRDTVTEFLTTVKEFQSGLMTDPNYGLLVGTYGASLLYTTGSRAMRREGDQIEAARPQISSFRAIPHNAVLQQLGLPANSISGVGEAVARNPAWFQQVHAASPRLRQMMSLVAYGVAMANPEALEGYIATLDPGLWLARAALSADQSRAASFRKIAEMLEDWDIHDGQRKVYRRLYNDLVLLRHGLSSVQQGDPWFTPECRRALILLHAIRIAVVQEIYLLATRIPEFSSRHDIANRRIFQRVLQLDIPAAVEMLRRIFPATPEAVVNSDFGEPASYVSDDTQSYQRENDQIFTPMLKLYDLIPRISIAIIHYIGALG